MCPFFRQTDRVIAGISHYTMSLHFNVTTFHCRISPCADVTLKQCKEVAHTPITMASPIDIVLGCQLSEYSSE